MNTLASFAPDAQDEIVVARFRLIARYGKFLANLKEGRVSVFEERNLYKHIRGNAIRSSENDEYPCGGVFRIYPEA